MRRGTANNMHPQSWGGVIKRRGGEGAQTEKIDFPSSYYILEEFLKVNYLPSNSDIRIMKKNRFRPLR